MIYRIYSDLPSFKEIRFHRGLNILLADKSPTATERQTRNGAGKTSLIELIHFLAGADCAPKSIFRNPSLNTHRFGMEFDLGDERVVVERSGETFGQTFVPAVSRDWPINPRMFVPPHRDWQPHAGMEPTPERQLYSLSTNDWRTVLGHRMFDLRAPLSNTDAPRFGPRFRQLFAYFVRRQASNAFNTPTRQSADQQLGDTQVAISFLIGLDWTISAEWEAVRQREKMLRELRKAAADGALGSVIGSTGELRTELAVAEDRTARLRRDLQDFRVLDQYREFEAEASEITSQLNRLADENTLDRSLLADLEQALRNEAAPVVDDLSQIYREAGTVLPGAVVRRFDEVRAFHESVVANRQSYLKGELDAARRRVAEREQAKAGLDARRAEIMSLMRTYGALDQFDALRAELTRREVQTEEIRQRFRTAEQLEGERTRLDIERAQLLLRLQQDFREQSDRLREAIVAFEETSRALYEEAGSLRVRESPNGPQFEITIHGQQSKGINNMQVFCFDMMLMRVCAARGIGPNFLVHDSHLFDGVDERQIGRALHVGARTAEELGFQYIVTMNSDDVPREAPDDLDFHAAFLPVKLTDATESGGLFGVRFD